MRSPYISLFFFFNDTATTEIYTLSLHDALPICRFDITKWQRYLSSASEEFRAQIEQLYREYLPERKLQEYLTADVRSEEHTSELQSLAYLVCRLLLEKKKKKI